jgi:hypothetical protein
MCQKRLRQSIKTYLVVVRGRSNVENNVADGLLERVADSEAIRFDTTPLEFVQLQGLFVELPGQLLIDLDCFRVIDRIGHQLLLVELGLDYEFGAVAVRKVLSLEKRHHKQVLVL